MKKAKPSAKKASAAVNPMWGGHYASGPAEIMAKINTSIGFDKKLYHADIHGSIAHAQMLAKQNIITAAESKAMIKGLQQILGEIEGGNFTFKDSLEDIHMNVEARLAEIIGPTAGKLHTARSRNDQVALDLRLYVKAAIGEVDACLAELQDALITRAEEHTATILPGFTHLQVAQPVTLGHHLLAYAEMFGRDRTRARDAYHRMNECPLGAAALAGTSFPIDREETAKLLGFKRPTANSLDSVSDRDFALEFLAPCPRLDMLAGYAVTYYRDFVKPTKKYRAPNELERGALQELADYLAHAPAQASAEDLQNEVYALGKKHAFADLKDWFGALYEVLLGQPQGPRMGSFIALYGTKETLALINRVLAGESLAA